MFKVISSDQFKTTPWKNGKGETIELAINEGGDICNFDWRLSIATVSENGVFSDFSGLRRDLFLIEGQGIKLTHNKTHENLLTDHLSVATFDGGDTTMGELLGDTIKDLNLMTKVGKYQVNTRVYHEEGTYELPDMGLCFIFSYRNDVCLINEYAAFDDAQQTSLVKGNLLLASDGLAGQCIQGKNILVIQLVEH